jgi:Protein of unknown function (DUF3017)
VDKAVLSGQGERSQSAPATATAATVAADAQTVPSSADPAAVSGSTDHPVGSAAGPAATEAPAGSPAVAAAAAVPGAVPLVPAAATTEVPARTRASRWANRPYALVLAVTAGGLAWVALGGLRHVQAGMIAVASALLAAAMLRLVLPERAVGLLVSRRRVLDVLTLASLGAGIMAAVLVLPAP